MSKHYDFIFAGSGLAALSILCRMMDDSFFADKQILLLDEDDKKKNDRTWSFWESEPGYFDELVLKRWHKATVSDHGWTKTFDLAPYTYKTIRGIDLYRHVFARMEERENIHFLQTKIVAVEDGDPARVQTEQGTFTAGMVLNSLFDLDMLRNIADVPVVYQHFKGYIIETKAAMDDQVVTFMDFSIPQRDTMQFMYVLPFSERSCLVEHTYFSQYFVSEETYDESLQVYCDQHFGAGNWTIQEVEKGVIPMTAASFTNGRSSRRMAYIGTLGGYTKASSGYTFYFIQKTAASIVEQLKQGSVPRRKPTRFNFYDALLLRVLAADEGFGHQLFSNLFQTNAPELVFTFLNEESTIRQDLAVITQSPTGRFLRALIAELRHWVMGGK